tara:strand:+ start:5528 stop:5956 length:429 start_codon:yes stop_codon:yes gene_type:complete
MELGFNESLLQPYWPLRMDQNIGPYESIKEAKESIHQNFVFLLQTIPGEWPMNPDLGIGLSQYLFETYGSQELDKLKERIQKQLKKYLPAVTLVKSEFVHSNADQDLLNTLLTIVYSIDGYGLIEEINFKLDGPTKSFVYVR